MAEAPNGALWIAKIPSREDRRDIGGWEMVVHRLAKKAGLDVPEAQLLRLSERHHTFACRRFDPTPREVIHEIKESGWFDLICPDLG